LNIYKAFIEIFTHKKTPVLDLQLIDSDKYSFFVLINEEHSSIYLSNGSLAKSGWPSDTVDFVLYSLAKLFVILIYVMFRNKSGC